jgi:AraC family transcriptional regulator of adaptative response / DNA-3-methyladenine glycosylase II
MRTASGSPIVVELEPDGSEPFVTLRVDGVGGEPPELVTVEPAARRLFDLDADPEAIDGTLASDPVLAPLVREDPGTRLPGATDGFELAVRAIVGQQVSVAGARTTLGRIAERFGEPLGTVHGTIVRLFPAPDRLGTAPPGLLGMPRGRAEAIVSVARAVTRGELDLSGAAEIGPTLDAFTSIRGVGEWTASYVAMRALRDPDAFPVGDLGLRRGAAALGLASDPASLRERAERWRPWRAYAAMHLWNARR